MDTHKDSGDQEIEVVETDENGIYSPDLGRVGTLSSTLATVKTDGQVNSANRGCPILLPVLVSYFNEF